jgi:hypothetical protein
MQPFNLALLFLLFFEHILLNRKLMSQHCIFDRMDPYLVYSVLLCGTKHSIYNSWKWELETQSELVSI